MPSRKRRVATGKFADDSLVPIDSERLKSAIELTGITRRALARAVGRPPSSIDSLCKRYQRSCRVKLRRKLAAELGVPDAWLGMAAGWEAVTPEQVLGTQKHYGQSWNIPIAWADLVLSLKLPPAVYSAVLDLPGAIGQASLAVGLISLGEGGAPEIDPSLGRPSLRELEAWHEWLVAWIELAGRAKVRSALIRERRHLAIRFARVDRYSLSRKG